MKPTESERSNHHSSQTELRDLLYDIKGRMDRDKKEKDVWDKASVIAQFLSGVVVAVIGTVIAFNVDDAQRKITEKLGQAQVALAKRQVEIADRAQFAEYLRLISEAHSEDERRASLIGALDLAVPDYKGQVAEHYVVRDTSSKVREAAIKVLASTSSGRKFLADRLSESIPEEDRVAIMRSLGREVPDVRVRLFEVDDLGKVLINGQELLQVSWGNDSGWVDVTKLMKPGTKNKIVGEIYNSPYGGWAGHLQVSAAGKIIDSGQIGRHSCPCGAKAAEIEVSIETDRRGRVKSVAAHPPRYL